MSYYSDVLTARVLEHYRKKNKETAKKKRIKYDADHFECACVSFLPIFVIGIIFFSVLIIVCVATNLYNLKDVIGPIWAFAVFVILFFGVAWACEHLKLMVDGDDAVYTNIWGFKKSFKISEVTKCLTTEQTIRVYAGNKKVATLDKDMHCLEFFVARCNSEGITWEPKSKKTISKLTLTWNSVRTIFLFFMWVGIILSIIMIPAEISSETDFAEMLVLEAVLFAGFSMIALMLMLGFAIELKEVWRIEKALGISFNEEMKQRGAIGSEYQNYEWFVEAVPGKIEVLNRRFIKKWLGIKKKETSETTLYHVEFIDINDKKRKIGGHYREYALEMDRWYRSYKEQN